MPTKSVEPKSKGVRPKKHIAIKRKKKEMTKGPSPKADPHSPEETSQ